MEELIRVAAAHRPPYVLYNDSAPVGSQFKGLLIQLLPVLLAQANISTPYEIYNAPDNEGGTFFNTSWNGQRALAVFYSSSALHWRETEHTRVNSSKEV